LRTSASRSSSVSLAAALAAAAREEIFWIIFFKIWRLMLLFDTWGYVT